LHWVRRFESLAPMQPNKLLRLENGGSSILDNEDYEWASKFRWFKSNHGYVYRQGWRRDNGKREHWSVFLHREINKTPPHLFTDHINGNKLDNRRCNLRTATKSQNGSNRGKPGIRNATSKFKGVSLHRSTGLWRCRVYRFGVSKCTYHRTPEEAAAAYNRAAAEKFGAFAGLNAV